MRERSRLSIALVKAFFGALFLIAGGCLAWRYNLPLAELGDRSATWNASWSFGAFIVLYSAISIFPVPGRDVAKIIGAELFGYSSILAVWIGEIAAAICAYGIARSGGHDLLRVLLGKRVSQLDRKLETASAWTIFILRIIPLTPYRYFNLCAGLVRLPFRPYLLGSIPGMLLRTALFQIAFVRLGDTLAAHGVTTWQVFVVSTILVPSMLGVWWWLRSRRGHRKTDKL